MAVSRDGADLRAERGDDAGAGLRIQVMDLESFLEGLHNLRHQTAKAQEMDTFHEYPRMGL
jgi:hypothetical protein